VGANLVLAQPSYDSTTRLICTLKSLHGFGAGEFVLSMKQLHFFPVGVKGASIFFVKVALKMSAKVRRVSSVSACF